MLLICGQRVPMFGVGAAHTNLAVGRHSANLEFDSALDPFLSGSTRFQAAIASEPSRSARNQNVGGICSRKIRLRSQAYAAKQRPNNWVS